MVIYLAFSVFTLHLSSIVAYNQWDIKIPRIFKFVTAAFKFASFLKFSASATCRYKIMERKMSERPIIRVHISIISFI
jgi:hypothetical protein